MRKIALGFLLLVGLLSAAVVSAVERPGLTVERVFNTVDSLRMYAWVSRPMSNDPAPLLVLLPMRARDHRSYDDLRAAIINRAIGFGKDKIIWPYVVAFDLRGHGRSKDRGGATVHFRDMPNEEYLKIPVDVAGAVTEILADSSYLIDPERIFVVGASIGANSAIMMTGHLSGVSKVAMLSPGLKYRGLEPEAALEAFEGDVTVFASEEDRNSFASARHLVSGREEQCTLEEFYGSEHGTDIINTYPEAMKKLIDWLFE
ncbi:MAG: alpha/beta fold hydrolase [bacterium]|nr:alpha/beta fold hydrolase [bacterium]